ncbi:hypothetical protein J4Q44_G00058270 [Coregonus suidteri]|uniref:Uncharacterized protein n=1 Tax=Coregonus suidteri TaxID=861788 RepID=A0AAN8M2F9_9TELE
MFRRRHKNLSLRRPDTLDRGRAECATRLTNDTFFTSYEKHLLAPWDAKHVYQQAPGTKEHITVLACFNAAGEDVPPFIIYPKCFPGGHYTLGGPYLVPPPSLLEPAVPSISTSSPVTTGGSSAPAPVPALALEEHPLIEGGLIAKDLGHILTVLKYRLDRYRRLPVVATCLTGEEYTCQWQERGEKERAEAEEKERRAALRTQRAQERAAMDETIDAIASAGPPAGTLTT